MKSIKDFWNENYVMVKKVAPIGSLILLAVNLAFTVYPFFAYRGIHPYLGVPVLLGIIIFLIWGMSFIYIQSCLVIESKKVG